MEKILSYLQYDYLICFGVDEHGYIRITGSSNRAICTDELLNAGAEMRRNKRLPLLKHNTVFLECYELLSKEKKKLKLLENEMARLASIRDLFKRTKKKLLKEKGTSLDTAQILFIMPLGWTEEHYKDKIHAFLLDMDWIAPKDNESKLIMIPFIQVLVQEFQRLYSEEQNLDSERTSVLFSVQPAIKEEGDKTRVNYTFFKMQGAKELIAVSKTLACSDFLLVPSIVPPIENNKSIYLADLRDVMYDAVRKIVVRIKGKDPECISNENTIKEEDPLWKIACNIPYSQEHAEGDIARNLGESFQNVNFEMHQLEDLKSWTSSRLRAAVFNDVNVKSYFEQVNNLVEGALDKSDGRIIQGSKNIYSYNDQHLDRYAMQQPYKMIQIANAILPPVIAGKEEQTNPAFRPRTHANSLIAPNSFYVQANVTDTQIYFILNKVIEVPPPETGIALSTVQERSIETEDIAEAASLLLWNYYQSMIDVEEQQHLFFECCQDHDNNRCTCALKLSQRLLLEVGLKPAIVRIANTIRGVLFSNAFFGLYQLSALILETNLKAINNQPFSCAIDGLLKQNLKEFLHVHYRQLLLLSHGKLADDDKLRYLGRGGYSQVSSTNYIFKWRSLNMPMDVFVSNHPEENAYQQRVGSMQVRCEPYRKHYFTCVSLRILPEHHSSTIKVALSYPLRSVECLIDQVSCVNVHERLFLKEQVP
ncbi:hypothetical protein MUCCIDRAFT_86916 [Mucor lusitanicus CBS 277.49]|uniref:Uncharacterized protein n=1 Tax=Mucor lusitanicus CBS 277.49 TaxID=747725 RepID=A0A168GDP9_MUCCL|nr:hypothetical protein MUCCIDRAFT_86916 [Mucor lusitanicus CBS 277.49]